MCRLTTHNTKQKNTSSSISPTVSFSSASILYALDAVSRTMSDSNMSAPAEDTTLQEVSISVDETKMLMSLQRRWRKLEKRRVPLSDQEVCIQPTSAIKQDHTTERLTQKANEGNSTKVKKLKTSRKVELSLLELFDTLDANDSGFLSNQEVLVGLHMLGLQVETSDLFQALSQVHSLGDGKDKMDPEKFLAFMKLISKTEDFELLNLLVEVLNSGHINSVAIREKLALHQEELNKRKSDVQQQDSTKLNMGSEASKKNVGVGNDEHFEEKWPFLKPSVFFVGKSST